MLMSLNIVIQFLFIRVTKIIDKHNTWGIMFPVLPLTGWVGDYKPDKRLIVELHIRPCFKANEHF